MKPVDAQVEVDLSLKGHVSHCEVADWLVKPCACAVRVGLSR